MSVEPRIPRLISLSLHRAVVAIRSFRALLCQPRLRSPRSLGPLGLRTWNQGGRQEKRTNRSFGSFEKTRQRRISGRFVLLSATIQHRSPLADIARVQFSSYHLFIFPKDDVGLPQQRIALD